MVALPAAGHVYGDLLSILVRLLAGRRINANWRGRPRRTIVLYAEVEPDADDRGTQHSCDRPNPRTIWPSVLLRHNLLPWDIVASGDSVLTGRQLLTVSLPSR